MFDTVKGWTDIPDGLNKLIMVDTTKTLFPETEDKIIVAIEKEMDAKKPELDEDNEDENEDNNEDENEESN